MDVPATQMAPNPFAYNEIVLKVALSAGIGLLVGFEREWAQKEIGVRTFASAAGTLAQKFLGSYGFLIVSVMGGFVSSASTTATALVAGGKVDPFTAGMATVLTSMTSALANTPLVYQQTRDKRLAMSLTLSTLLAITLGIAAMLGTYLLLK